MSKPRGIRNNNPLNLMDFGINWKGLASPRHDPDQFCIFQDPVMGIRAGAMDLINDWSEDGKRSIRALITEFAPESHGNPTSHYIKYVVEEFRRAGINIDADDDLDLNDYVQCYTLVTAIIEFESGVQPYNRDTITRALVLAGVEPPAPVSRQPEITGGSAVAAAGGLTLVSQAVDQLQPATPLLQTLARQAPWVLGALVFVVAGWLAWRAWRGHKTLCRFLERH